MQRENQGVVLRQMRTLFRAGACSGLSDGELLARFAARRDESAEAAFEVLVERHGAMVFRVCRGVLRDADEAADAFQATFLLLARRAATIRDQDAVGSWLYGVALRVAACARSAAARRKVHECRAGGTSIELDLDDDSDDLEAAIHEEVGRLPERYRVPIVLCYLEGMTQEEAARRIGCPLGTVRSRLARARDRLRGRLARRGFGPSVAGLTALLAAESAGAALPAGLASRTIRLALRASMRRAASAGAVPASVAALTRTVLRTMLVTKLKTFTLAAFAAGALATGAAGLAQQSARTQPESASTITSTSAAPDHGSETSGTSDSSLPRSDAERLTTPPATERNDPLARLPYVRELFGARTQPPTGSRDALAQIANPGPDPRPAAKHETTPKAEPPSASLNEVLAAVYASQETPTDAEVWRKLLENRFQNIRVKTESVSETLDGYREYPLVGRCQLIHGQYKCTVDFDERNGDKFDHRTEVVHLEKDFLRRCPEPARNHDAEALPLNAELRAAMERVQWAEKMLQRGYVSKAQAMDERARLERLLKDEAVSTLRPGSRGAAPAQDASQEQRLRDVERKLDEILKAIQDVNRARTPDHGTTPLPPRNRETP